MTPLHSVKQHVYVEVKFVQWLPTCSCGWRSNTPTADEQRARDLWEYHRNRCAKGEPQ